MRCKFKIVHMPDTATLVPSEARFPLEVRLNLDGFLNFLKCRSRLQEHHGPATLVFSVLDHIANLLTSVQGPAMLHLS